MTACATRGTDSFTPLADASGNAAATPSAKVAAAARTGSGTASGRSERKTDDDLPNVELDEDLLYKLLTAEIAAQRGDWETAFVGDLTAAQQTGDPRLARRAAEIAMAAKQPDEALAAVRLWRKLAPDSDEALQYYLSFLIVTDNLADAKPILEQRLKEARPQTRGLLAFQIQRLLTRTKDKAAGFKLLQDVLAPYGDISETHLALAQGAHAAGDDNRARAEAQAALKVHPDSELAALTLAQVIPDRDASTKALADFLAAHPKSSEVRMAYARMLIEQKQYAAARKEFESLLKEKPDDLTSLFALGVLGVQTNDYKSAENYLNRYITVLSANPDDERDPTQALMLLAQLAEERGDSDAALKWLQQIEPGDSYLLAQMRRAQIIAKRGDVEGARRLLHEQNASGEKDKAQLIQAEGQILRDANRLNDALAVFKDGVRLYPDNTDLLYDYAMAAEKANKLDIMETSLRRLIQLAPHNQHAYNALGYSFAERNIRLPEAFELVQKALSLAPEDPFIMDSMGWVQFRLGKLKEAEELLRRAYTLRPDAEIAVHLGEVLWVKGERADAQKLWRDARSKDPQNDTLKSTLARLNVNL